MDQAKKYLSLLDPNANKFVFACYDYRKVLKGRQFYGTFGSVAPKLKECNEGLYCVYVTVNETEGPRRKKDDIKRCRAIWVEDDDRVDAPRADWPIKPSMIVQSSPQKYHYYWLTSTTKLDEWNAVMQTMVTEWGCDNKAKDLARVMRLPGFVHKKDINQPFTCELIEDNGRVYNWFEIKAVFKPSDKKSSLKAPGTIATAETPYDYSEQEAIKSLLSSENYHGSLTSIAMSLTNKGISRDMQYMTLFGLMHKIPADKRRPEWEARCSDEHLYECIDSGIAKLESEENDIGLHNLKKSDFADNDLSLIPSEVRYPPGKMGDLCQEIYEMAPYPNMEIALSGAMGLVAGIAGRHYNVMGMGLNLYIAILADSGIGKANLKDSINLALRSGGGKMNIGATFVGKSRFTGPKPIFEMLSNGLSRICVLEEAGLISESRAGDGSGITRVLLDLFTSSGYGKWAGDEGYSDNKNNIPALHSPALSVVNVSTPKSFLKALKSKSADVSGEVARLWMMRSLGEKPYLNKERRKDFSKGSIAILGRLITKCVIYQSVDAELDTFDVEVSDDILENSDTWVDLENKYLREGDHLRRTLCSRAFAKIIKMSALASVYNGKNHIGQEEYDWADWCINKELNSIQESFTHESNDDLGIVAQNIVAPCIVKILLGEYSGDKKNAPLQLAERGIFTHYNIYQVLRSNTVLKEIDDDTTRNNPRTGMDKVIQYMIRAGMLTVLDHQAMTKYGSRSKVGYKITNDFKINYLD